MTPEDMVQMARRLTDEVALVNMTGSNCDLQSAADDAAQWLELVAPLMPVILPLLSGSIRRRVESHSLDNARRMTDELAKALFRLVDAPAPSITAVLEAGRVLSRYQEWREVNADGLTV